MARKHSHASCFDGPLWIDASMVFEPFPDLPPPVLAVM
jgi:hypothetical protein